MPSVKRIETTSSDGTVKLESMDGATVSVWFPADGIRTGAVPGGTVSEAALLEAVLEYAHERGLRRARKARVVNGSGKRKTRVPATEQPAAVQ